MTRDLGIFTHEDAIEIGRRVLGNRYKQPSFDNTRDVTVHNDLYYVVLTEDLDPATNSKTGYTTAQGRILRYVQPAVSDTLNMEDSTTDEGLVSITNRFTTFSASTGDLILIIRNGSEWSPVDRGTGRLQVKLTTDLLAAVNTKRDPSTATARILRRKSNGDLTLSTSEITVVNRFENISIDSGTYVKVEYIDGEWQPYAADCPSDASTSESF